MLSCSASTCISSMLQLRSTNALKETQDVKSRAVLEVLCNTDGGGSDKIFEFEVDADVLDSGVPSHLRVREGTPPATRNRIRVGQQPRCMQIPARLQDDLSGKLHFTF